MLSRIRVLDLTDGGAGMAGQILADLGADVVLVEPIDGAASRRLGPFAHGVLHPDRSLEFWSVHRGKRSVVVDVDTEEGREHLLALASGADVWLDDAAPGRRDAAGLGWQALAGRNPALVHVAITPFGERGPKATWAATDLTVSAASQCGSPETTTAHRSPVACRRPSSTPEPKRRWERCSPWPSASARAAVSTSTCQPKRR